ncbi:MAG: metalloregulator ArsR/SmtB family transcription factor [Gammaproteobacteria bacterium]|nr:metalloregulator ArsR/SmtB family transcription factor [Gammaproteobacteria bacterium]
MEQTRAIDGFQALAHVHRLRIFRGLVRKGDAGASAGDIADRLKMAPSSLSFHLDRLERAGLIRSERRGRRVIYAVDRQGTRALLAYLTEDCCDGRPELCGELILGHPAKPARRRSSP